MSAYQYYQQVGGEESWHPFQVSQLEAIETKEPMFITVLSVSKLVEDLSYEDKLKLAYMGPAYFDWDGTDHEVVIEKVNQFLDKLVEMEVDLSMCRLYATGKKGFHLEIPPGIFMEKVPNKGVVGLPNIYREMALALCVDTLDLKIYSSGRGRMWRQANVKRDNGRYKVPITLAEMRSMTPEGYERVTSEPRWDFKEPSSPHFCSQLAIIYARAQQRVEELLAKRKRFKPDPQAKQKAQSPSIQYMMAGLGIRADAGFQEIAVQLSIAATTAGLSEDEFITECEGLITSHRSDGSRYNTEAKRRDELRRMHRYMDGNSCYEFSIGGIKALLNHGAPDLDGLPATKEEIADNIKEAAVQEEADEQEIDEYADVAKGVTLEKYGVYADTEYGKKRICAMSFANPSVLRSASTSQIIGYEAEVLVNGAVAGRAKLELDVFMTLTNFNRWASKYGHALQGNDAQVRTVMMRFVEKSKKKGRTQYVVEREGLDLVSIPFHEDERLREPFLIWADHKGVKVEPRIRETGLEIVFAGHPDPRGVYRTDLSAAPSLPEWLEEGDNRQQLHDMLKNLMTCQKPEVLGKLIGWYFACFWKQLFQEHYKKFPLLHVNGPAGLGKTELNLGIGQLFFWQNSVRPLSPSSTPFAINQHLTASSSIPMIFDEYKPHEMMKAVHDKLKGMLRDAYNQRDVARGGGTRESDDYRMLQFTQMAAPLVFIAEAAEEEAAVMERVVLVTLARPPQSVGLKNYARFQAFQREQHLMGILGQYTAADIVESFDHDTFQAEFDEMYNAARSIYMLTEEDLQRQAAGKISEEEIQKKQSSKERSVYNHTVAKFGFQKFRRLVNDALENAELDQLMAELEDSIYARMSDLHAATTPEYVKVLQQIANMTYSVESTRPEAIRKGFEYALTTTGAGEVVELAGRTAYMRYRSYERSSGCSPLFQGYEAFAHALRDSPAYVKMGMGEVLHQPNVLTFRVGELAKLGVAPFKD